nr:MAG TPA: Major capsid protein [Bacteriophage sp.]
MPNTIALAKNYINYLDEAYRLASVTSDLTSDPTMSKAGANANEIVYPQISVSGLGDYDRNSGYTTGAVDLKWKTATFNYDRGTRISVDVMDNEESRNLAFGMAGATLMREKAAPEADAFAFATLAALDGISKATGTIADASQFLDALLTAWSKMDEDEVPQEQRVLYATATLLNSVMALDTTKSREILGKFAVKKAVPQARFYTAIEMLDGKSSGEELGHYKKATSAADINFMIIHKPAVIKFDKHIASNIIPAEANPDADADIIKYRKYGLVEAYANKRAGIYLNSKE